MAKRKNTEKFDMQLTPYSYHRLYGDEKYNLQNMVLNMVSFPAEVDHGIDKTFSIYSDRAHTEWGAAARMVSSKESGDAWFAGLNAEQFLLFAGKLFGALNTPISEDQPHTNKFRYRVDELYKNTMTESGLKEEDREYLTVSIKAREDAEKKAMEEVEALPLTGAIMIRMTNVSSGYPCPVLIGVIQKSEAPKYSGNAAPFIQYSMPRRGSRFGWDEAEYADYR
jgi:hypothetical protein